jgi:golgin subfamily B member 1
MPPELDSSSVRAYEELERLLGKLERWHDVVDLLERRAEQEAERGNVGAELRILAHTADLWDSKLDQPEQAGALIERILQRDPASVPALTRLSRLYERANDWAQSKAALERALELGPEGSDAADLFFRLAEVARVGDQDADTAVQHLQQALRHDPDHREALATLEMLARERRDTATLAGLLRRRAASVKEVAERVAIALEIADLERRSGRTAEALSELEAAAKLSPSDARVWAPLADLLFAAGRLDEAGPIYERLAEEAKAARRMRDVARYRQRQGGILEARGNAAAALLAYEEAFRVNPTDVATMAGLGRLYFAAKEWEKARRLYQSLVLQTLETDSGIAKADVYCSLGVIHLELGQEAKAKGMFQRGLELDPRHERLRASLAKLSAG